MAKKRERKIVRMVVGGVLLVVGITLILVWWPEIMAVFQAVLALGLALAGLVVLYTVRN